MTHHLEVRKNVSTPASAGAGGRMFGVGDRNRLWAGGIARIGASEGRLHPAAAAGARRRKVAGWPTPGEITKRPAAGAPEQAAGRESPPGGLALPLRDGQGPRRASRAFRRCLESHGMAQPVPRPKDPRGSAPAKPFLKALKCESAGGEQHATRDEASQEAFEHIEPVHIIDPDDGHICGPGKPGELCCKGYNVMKGYYKMPEETAQAIDEGRYLHSGDLGMVDEDSYYRVTGRIKDMIIRGGENVYPLEVENFLLTMPGVLDTQVIGIPDEKYGEIVGAFIRTRPGYEGMTEEEVRAYAIPRIARYKVPKRVFFVDDFPMTPSMKIQKFKLRETAQELISQGR